jgi:hypothetical protein
MFKRRREVFPLRWKLGREPAGLHRRRRGTRRRKLAVARRLYVAYDP